MIFLHGLFQCFLKAFYAYLSQCLFIFLHSSSLLPLRYLLTCLTLPTCLPVSRCSPLSSSTCHYFPIYPALPAATYHCLFLHATACLPLPSSACFCLPIPAFACLCIRLPVSACFCLPLPACLCLPLPASAFMSLPVSAYPCFPLPALACTRRFLTFLFIRR